MRDEIHATRIIVARMDMSFSLDDGWHEEIAGAVVAARRDNWSLTTPCTVRLRRQPDVRGTVLWVRQEGDQKRLRGAPALLLHVPVAQTTYTSFSVGATRLLGVQSNGHICWEAFDTLQRRWRLVDEVRDASGGAGWRNGPEAERALEEWMAAKKQQQKTKKKKQQPPRRKKRARLECTDDKLHRLVIKHRSVTHPDVVSCLVKQRKEEGEDDSDIQQAQLALANGVIARLANK